MMHARPRTASIALLLLLVAGCGSRAQTGFGGGFLGGDVSFGSGGDSGGEDAPAGADSDTASVDDAVADGDGPDAADTASDDATLDDGTGPDTDDADDAAGALDVEDGSGDGDAETDGAIGDSGDTGAADCDSGCGGDVADGNTSGDTGGDVADCVSGCDAGATDAGAGADVDASGPPPGPQPLSSCTGKDGDKACSEDGKVRLECINGAWTPIAHCGFGVCKASPNPSGPPTLLCEVPETDHPNVAAACARYVACFAPSLGQEACVRAALTPAAVASDVGGGRALTVAEVAVVGIAPVAACVAAATSCVTVSACLQPPNPPTCASSSATGCSAQFAYQCSGGAPLVADCSAIGTSCVTIGGQPRCVIDQPCPAGNVSSCQGRVALACVSTSIGNRGVQIDCGATGQTCLAGQPVASAATSACGAAVPCAAGLQASCQAGMRSLCEANKHVESACAKDAVCLYADEFDVGVPSCPPLSSCETVRCAGGVACSHAAKCQGTEVWYCEQGQPRRFDCKTIGKTCTGGTNPRCS